MKNSVMVEVFQEIDSESNAAKKLAQFGISEQSLMIL